MLAPIYPRLTNDLGSLGCQSSSLVGEDVDAILVPVPHGRVVGHPVGRLLLAKNKIAVVDEFLNAFRMRDTHRFDVEPAVPIESWARNDIESVIAFTDAGLLAPRPRIEIVEQDASVVREWFGLTNPNGRATVLEGITRYPPSRTPFAVG
ncbi:MAG: hypothetical protein A3A28_03350 [Candidatus Sungbacteria bacterium RIFCSPLOWO2_01_FULL_47_32]|nr:MAG: hypothetical protein A3A28_03350 [Candidatus Sungbacteria bacterium RIFCSPLOWO2_01_FULL_47_32]